MNKFFLCSALFYGASASCPDGFSSSGDGYCTPTLGGRTQDGPGENTMCRNAETGNGNGQTKWYNDVAPADCKAACDSTTDCQAYSAHIGNKCLLHWPAGATSPPASFADTILGPIPVSSAWCYFYPNTFTSCDYMQFNSPLTGYVYQFGWSCHIKGGAAAAPEGFADGECATCEWDGGKMKVHYMGEESRTDSRVQDGAKSNQQVNIASLHTNFHCERLHHADDCSCTCGSDGDRSATICQDEWTVEEQGCNDTPISTRREVVGNFNECKQLCIAEHGDNCGWIQFERAQSPGDNVEIISSTTNTDTTGHQCWIGTSGADHNTNSCPTDVTQGKSVWKVLRPTCTTHTFV